MDNKRQLTAARDILLKIANHPHNPKFNYLAKSEITRAKIFRTENLNRPQKYNRYKRGTIVFIHFGTNTGTEFSNSHFGIVLDKKDHPNNGKLTVLPLTSKNGKNNISIGKAVFSGIMNENETAVNKIKELFKLTDAIELSSFNLPEGGYIYRLNEDTEQTRLWLDYYNRHDPEGKFIPVEIDTIRKWLQADTDKITSLKTRYANYDKVSYAKVDSITSVSKLKIAKPINDLDPIGRITLSKEVMDDIDRALAKQLLSGKWIKFDKENKE